jgi:hypothetical protein
MMALPFCQISVMFRSELVLGWMETPRPRIRSWDMDENDEWKGSQSKGEQLM